MSVPISEIRKMATEVFDALEQGGVTHLDPSQGLYWCIDSTDAWNMKREPTLLTGDLADDIHDIRADLTEFRNIAKTNVWHTLDHLVGVMTALSYQFKAQNGLAEKEEI